MFLFLVMLAQVLKLLYHMYLHQSAQWLGPANVFDIIFSITTIHFDPRVIGSKNAISTLKPQTFCEYQNKASQGMSRVRFLAIITFQMPKIKLR